jgi:hypothetical protein
MREASRRRRARSRLPGSAVHGFDFTEGLSDDFVKRLAISSSNLSAGVSQKNSLLINNQHARLFGVICLVHRLPAQTIQSGLGLFGEAGLRGSLR